jgi:hypothetical protein
VDLELHGAARGYNGKLFGKSAGPKRRVRLEQWRVVFFASYV